jgi:hypothetical protein
VGRFGAAIDAIATSAKGMPMDSKSRNNSEAYLAARGMDLSSNEFRGCTAPLDPRSGLVQFFTI